MTVTWSSMKTLEYSAHKKKVHSVAWSGSGTKLASGSVDQSVRIWVVDESGGAKDTELKGHQDSVDQLRWDPTNPEVLGTASGDKTVRIWDARSGKCAHAIETKGENINIRWSPDGQHIAVGDKDDNISFVEMRKCGRLLAMRPRLSASRLQPSLPCPLRVPCNAAHAHTHAHAVHTSASTCSCAQVQDAQADQIRLRGE